MTIWLWQNDKIIQNFNQVVKILRTFYRDQSSDAHCAHAFDASVWLLTRAFGFRRDCFPFDAMVLLLMPL